MTDQNKDIEEAGREESKAPAPSSDIPDVHNHDDQGLEHSVCPDESTTPDPDKEGSTPGPFSGMEALLDEGQKIVPADEMLDEVKENMEEPVLEVERDRPDDVKEPDEGQSFMVSENDEASIDDESPIIPTDEYGDEPPDADIPVDEDLSGEEEEPGYGTEGHDDEQSPLTQEMPSDVNLSGVEDDPAEDDLDFGIPESEQEAMTQEDGPSMEYPSAPGMETAAPTAANTPPVPPPSQEKREGENSYAQFSPATPEKPKNHATMATAFSLLALAGAAGALLMAIQMSDHLAHLDTQLSNTQEHSPVRDQSGEIADINRRLDDLGRTVAARIATPAETATKDTAPPAKAPVSPSVVKPKPEVQPPAADSKASAAKPAPGIQAIAAASGTPATNPETDPWVVNLTSLNSAAIAKRELAHLRKLGVPAEDIVVNIHGKRWHRLRVTGFASAEKARKERKALADRLAIKGTWIGRL